MKRLFSSTTAPVKARFAPNRAIASLALVTFSLSASAAELTDSEPWNCSSWMSLLLRTLITSSASLSFLGPGPTNRKGTTANLLEACPVEALLAADCVSGDCGARRAWNSSGVRNRTTAAISASKVVATRATIRRGFRGLTTASTWFRVLRRV